MTSESYDVPIDDDAIDGSDIDDNDEMGDDVISWIM